jgi:predicted nicotinamide N-methyase
LRIISLDHFISNARLTQHRLTHDDLKASLARHYMLAELSYPIGGKRFRFFSVANSYDLLDKIDPKEFQKDERMPYWAEIWHASLALAEFAATTDITLAGKRCLEIGAGVGVVSVTAASCGASVLPTDYFSEALDFISLNALANDVRLEPVLLDWRNVTLAETFDVIFASDVLYERPNHLPVLSLLSRLLKPDGTAYISDPRRAVAQNFITMAGENEFRVATVQRDVTAAKRTVTVDIHTLKKINGSQRLDECYRFLVKFFFRRTFSRRFHPIIVRLNNSL